MLLATNNQHKVLEMRKILGNEYPVISQKEAGIVHEVIENGISFEENAVKKAVEIMKFSGMPALADDSGLMVDALGGAPGIYTARYAGDNASDKDNIAKLLHELRGIVFPERKAKFVCVLALAAPGRDVIVVRGECHGYIATEAHGSSGFGYDPVFYFPKYDVTFAELSPHIKNFFSHRAAAVRRLKQKLDLVIPCPADKKVFH